MDQKKIESSAPGRICLFGEHQDYLHFPVITAAINLNINISGQQRKDSLFTINLPDLNEKEKFQIPFENEELSYTRGRDYFRSVFNLLIRNGAKFEKGWDCTVRGNIPINSGTSSSSALCVAWTKFLLEVSSVQKTNFRNPSFIGRLAYLAEVEEFGEPGGMMDHYAVANGGILYQDFKEKITLEQLPNELGNFVLGDSLESKDTLGILKRVKFGVLEAVKKIKKEKPNFKLESVNLKDLDGYQNQIPKSQLEALKGAILNRNITQKALNLFKSKQVNERNFGDLLNEHQKVLAGQLNVSTPKIDRMLQAAMDAGAYGGKINGSGGGGCMFVYAPEDSKKVAKSIEECGGKAYIITITKASF